MVSSSLWLIKNTPDPCGSRVGMEKNPLSALLRTWTDIREKCCLKRQKKNQRSPDVVVYLSVC